MPDEGLELCLNEKYETRRATRAYKAKKGAAGFRALGRLDAAAGVVECGQALSGGSGSDCAGAAIGVALPTAVDRFVEPRVAADVARRFSLNHNTLQQFPNALRSARAAIPNRVAQQTARVSTFVDAAYTALASPISPVSTSSGSDYGFVCC